MKLTRQGRRVLHDEIMSAIRGRLMTGEFAQDIEEVVIDATIDGDDDVETEWPRIVEQEVQIVLDKAIRLLE